MIAAAKAKQRERLAMARIMEAPRSAPRRFGHAFDPNKSGDAAAVLVFPPSPNVGQVWMNVRWVGNGWMTVLVTLSRWSHCKSHPRVDSEWIHSSM